MSCRLCGALWETTVFFVYPPFCLYVSYPSETLGQGGNTYGESDYS